MEFRTEFALWAVLVVALAANPVWFFPHAEEPASEYRAVEITEENQFRYAEQHPEVLRCYDSRGRACAFEAAASDGGIAVNASDVSYHGGGMDHRYVVFPDGFYEPAMEQSGETVRLTLTRRSRSAVVRNLSYPYGKASDPAREVVRKGTATVLQRIPDRDRIVRRNGTYYALRQTGYQWQRHPRIFPEVRWLLWLGTVPVSVVAMWRWT